MSPSNQDFVSVSFSTFPCSRGHSIRAYLNTIWMTLFTPRCKFTTPGCYFYVFLLMVQNSTLVKKCVFYDSYFWMLLWHGADFTIDRNNHHNFLLRYTTIEKIVDKLRFLKNIILAGTNLCRKSIAYICTYLTSTIEKINLGTERVRDSDIRALINHCPNITFLNLTETLVTREVFHELATAWGESMRYLSLPKRIATELNLASERVRN